MSNRRKTAVERAAQGVRNRCRACRRRFKDEWLRKGDETFCPACGARQ